MLMLYLHGGILTDLTKGMHDQDWAANEDVRLNPAAIADVGLSF
jgi:hypothetical protein